MSPLPDEILTHLERVDPDRWLAARMVEDASARVELLALYALNDEWARVGESVREPMLGEMRFAWWREALDDVARGRGGRGHPVLETLTPALASGRLPRAPLERMLDARTAVDLARAPFADTPALERHLDATAGALMEAAAGLLDPGARDAELSQPGRAWGWAGLWRARELWEARGRRWTPGDWAAEGEPEARRTAVLARVKAALEAARPAVGGLPVAAFPAVAYAALAASYARGKAPGPLAKRATLLKAATLGRL